MRALSLLAVTLLAASCSGRPRAVVTEDNRYLDPARGISLAFPEGWSLERMEGAVILGAERGLESGGSLLFNLGYEGDPRFVDGSTEAARERLLSTFSGGGWSLVDGGAGAAGGDGLECLSFIDASFPERPLLYEYRFTVRDGTFLLLSFVGPSGSWPQWRLMAEEVAGTLRLSPPGR